MPTAPAKTELRRRLRLALAAVTPAVRLAASIEACDRLRLQMPSASAVLFYAPLPDELDVWPLMEEALARGILCALPAFDPAAQTYGARRVTQLTSEIRDGNFGVREPDASCPWVPLHTFNLILVPGLAFDLHGNRLGRSRGFYDRLLAEVAGLKCGVCHDGQVVPAVPCEPHDIPMDFILTPSKLSRRS